MNKREQARLEMRAKILKAARKAFTDHGYDGTSFKTITELSGAGKQLIIYHFKTKEDLWKEVVVTIRDEFFIRFAELAFTDEDMSDPDRHRLLTRAFIRANMDLPEYGRLILREALTPSERSWWFQETMRPPEVDNPGYKSEAYAKAWGQGLGANIQTGALFYLTQMGEFMELSPGNEIYPINPMTEKTINKVADLLVEVITPLAKELEEK